MRQAQSGIRAKNYSWSTIHSVSKIRQCARFAAKIHNPCDFWGQIRRIRKPIHPPHQSLTSPPSPPWFINPLNPRGISSTRYMKSRLAIKFPTPMSGDQIPSLPGRKRRPMPGVCAVGGMLKLRFDWYITGLCKFAQNISTNIWGSGKCRDFKFRELSSFPMPYNITLSWLYPQNSFWSTFSLRDSENYQ